MKPLVVYTRPSCWQKYKSDKLDLLYVPLTGPKPLKRSGKPGAPDDHYLRAHPSGMKELVKVLRERKPQVLLRWINTGMTQEMHERVRAASPSTIIMVADGNNPSGVHKYAKRYKHMIDVFLINSRDPAALKRYKEVGYEHVGTMYDGFDPKHHTHPEGKQRDDCFFAGSNRRQRIVVEGKKRPMWVWDFPGGEFRFNFISAVQRQFRLALHGTRKEWPMPKGFKVKPVLRYPAHVKAFRNAKVILACCQFPDVVGFYTRRIIHSGASGRPVVARYVAGMEKDFGENGDVISWFETVDEGIEAIDRYVKDKNLRERKGKKCRKFFLEHHSWESRLREFEKIVARVL